MPTLSEQLNHAASPSSILETSLGRIWQHHGKTGFAILTAWRGERAGIRSADELKRANEKSMRELAADLKAGGFGYVPVEGVGQEERGGKIIQAPEPSFLVPNVKRGGKKAETGELRTLVMRLGKKYEQTAVLVHDPGSGSEIVSPAGAVLGTAKSFSANMAGEFFTRLRGGRTFRLEDLLWWGLRYGDPPGNWLEGMAMENDGRIQIHACSDRLGEWMTEVGV